jgi:Mrp family chromosome partitioning ATPase
MSRRGGKRKAGSYDGEGKVVTVFNFKGGAAKTTLVANLAAAMVKSGGDRLGKQPKV